jgi:hypothetical protein
LVAAGIVLTFGANRRWRGPTLAGATIATVVISGMLEVLIFLLEFGAHLCGE